MKCFVSVMTESTAGQLLVVTTSWYPGWRATIDQDENVPIYRVNGSFMAVPVPAGAHHVRLEYRPCWLTAWFWLSAGVMGVLMLACSCELIRRLFYCRHNAEFRPQWP